MSVAGTNLDVNSIVSQLMTLERQPLTQMDVKEASYQAKISAYGTIKSALASLQTAVQPLTQPNTFKTLKVTSSDLDVLSGSADTTAAPGSYTIKVDQLATANTVHSNDGYTSLSDTFSTGTLSIKAGSGAAVNITIDQTNNTLSGIRNAINSAGAGVSASIINDGTNQRLVLTSNTMGAAGAINVTATDSGSGGTFALGGLASTNLTETQPAEDAKLTVNGLSITRPTNTISDVVSGLTLTLGQEGTTTVNISKDNTTAINALSAFVTAYNAVVTQNSTLGAFDSTNQTASVLTGDSTLRSIQNKLGSLAGTMVSGIAGGLTSLTNVGVSLQRDGTLSLDTGKLTLALSNSNNDISSLFTQTTTGAPQGIAVQLNSWLNDAVGSTGILASSVSGINTSIQGIEDQRTALTDRLSTIETNYRTQYAALDALISSMNSTSTFLTQQLANLPGTTSSSK